MPGAYPAVKPRYAARTAESMRSSSASAAGTANGMAEATIFFFARVIRAAMVGSLTRKSRAISGVATPRTRRNANAAWASGARAGWQVMNTRRSRSSLMSAVAVTSSSPSFSVLAEQFLHHQQRFLAAGDVL